MEHVRALSVGIGPRVSGSPQSRLTVSYIANAFRDYGYAVEVMEFNYPTRFRLATVTVGGETIEGLALNGAATGEKSAEGPAHGEASPDGMTAEGAVTIEKRGESQPEDGLLYMSAARANAAALIIVNRERYGFWGFPIPVRDAIPVVLVRAAEEDRLSQAAGEGAAITVTVGPALPAAANVIARPAPEAECDILAGGHHDTTPGAPGALDNASGVAIVLELARSFAADGLDEGLCFATFGAEESGLFGSAALARRWEASGELPEVMVNFDVTARGDAIEVIGTPALVNRAVGDLEASGIAAFASNLPRGYGSDHMSFEQVGVPVLFLSDGDVSLIHTPADVIDRVEPAAVDRIGDAGALMLQLLLAEIAGGP
jgi:Iap family predicted aminopeptidase